METTIRISGSIKSRLDKLKMIKKESYNDVIEILLEDYLELNEKTKKEIGEARERIAKGEFYTQEEVEKNLGL
jgi:predicted transcriptional regulator